MYLRAPKNIRPIIQASTLYYRTILKHSFNSATTLGASRENSARSSQSWWISRRPHLPGKHCLSPTLKLNGDRPKHPIEHVCQSDLAERQVFFLCNNFSHWCENCSNPSCMGPVHGSDFLLTKPLIYTEKCRLIHGPTACYRSITLQAMVAEVALPSPTIRAF